MRLAILGASARAAACSAIDGGFHVTAADLFADADLAARCPVWRVVDWPGSFADWLPAQEIDGWLYTGGLENYPDLIANLAAQKRLWGVGADVLRQVRCPVQLATALEHRGCPYPEIRGEPPRASSGADWLQKRLKSAGGIGVRDWSGAIRHKRDTYYQRRVDGRAIAAAYVAAGGESVLLGVTEQLIGRSWTSAARYQYAGSVGPIPLSPNMHCGVRRAGAALVEAFDLVGLVGVDFVVDAAGTPWLVDVNPRYTASMEVVERTIGSSVIAAHVEACASGRVPEISVGNDTRHFGKAYLFACCDVTVGELAAPGRADVPAAGTKIQQGHPVATVLVDAACWEEVEPSLQRAVVELEADLYQ